MDLDDGTGAQARFEQYTAELASVLGPADRVRPFADYCVGLLSAEGRKSVEPLAAVTAPERTAAQHQSLLHFVAQAPWSDQTMLRRVRECVLPSITRDEPIQAWIIDDTGFPKKGGHSVGVARQYCGQLGKQDNCQVAVSLSVATHQGSLPVAWRLYLPKEWADDAGRRATTGVPDDICFQTKSEIALQQVREALADGVPPGVDLRGRHPARHDGLASRRSTVAAGVQSGPRAARQAAASRRDASSGRRQDTGSGTPCRRLATDQMAGRQQHSIVCAWAHIARLKVQNKYAIA